ncbi:MAG: Ca2+/Na+ antiporter [Mariniblastus sp.]|jgi:Ca2+/Na+ antiporter
MPVAAETIADESVLAAMVVGTMIVANVISFTELVACIVLVRVSGMDLVIGNVFSGSPFNRLLLILLSASYSDWLTGSVSVTHLVTWMFVVLITSAVIIGQLYCVEFRKLLAEPKTAQILRSFNACVVTRFFRRGTCGKDTLFNKPEE